MRRIIFLSALLLIGATAPIALSSDGFSNSKNTSSNSVPEMIDGYPVSRTHGSIITVDTVGELMQRSDLIVIGKTTKSITQGTPTLPRDSDGGIYGVFTEVDFKVQKVFKGDKNLKEIRLGQQAAFIQEPGQQPYVRVFDEYTPMEPNTKYLMFLKKGLPGTLGENLYFPVGVYFGQHNLVSDAEEKRASNKVFKEIRKLVRQQFKE
jgi:hypothetical protein